MIIKTQDGDKNVASKGLGGTALGLSIGALGAVALGLNGGGLLNNMGYNNCYNNNCNYCGPCSDNCCVNRYELRQNAKISELESIIGNQNSKIYTDGVGTELFAELRKADKEQDAKRNALFRETFTALAALDKDTAVNTAVINKNLELLNYKIDTQIQREREYVDGHFVKGNLKLSICDICPVPAVADAVQPTPVCGLK